jgi:hypothetical protein
VIEIRDVALAARAGEPIPPLSPDRIAALSVGLPALDPAHDPALAGRDGAGQEAGDELRPLLVLARRWPHGARHRPGVPA